MAQYGHNWYGTSYYGQTNAFSGWYETREVNTDELLKGPVTINIRAALPTASYGPTSPEVQQMAGTWTYDATLGKIYSNSTNAKLYFAATCDKLTIKYEQRTIAAKVSIKVTTTEVGKTPVVTTYTLNTQAATVNANMTYDIPITVFGQHQVEITMAADSPAGANFNFKGFTARTANLTIEGRARLNSTAWVEPSYTKLSTTITAISGSTDYMVSATTASWSGKNNVQFKIYLASSDNETTPEVKYVEMTSGDTDNRTSDGQWTATFDMAAIASAAGASFSKVEEVVWTEEVPATTSLTIRSQSSIDNLNQWDAVTVPYRQKPDGTPYNRIRLKEGNNSGWIDTPVNAPAFRPYVSTVEWIKWDDQSYLPPDNAGVTVTYDFVSPQRDNTTNPYVRILNPMTKANRNLVGNARLRNLDNVIRITLRKPNSTKQTPVVDFIHLQSKMHYEQDVETKDQEFSAVDFQNTGKGIVLETSTIAGQYQIPPEAGLPVTYELIDQTRRPQDVMLYLDTQKTQALRNNKTTNIATNKIWAESKRYSRTTKTGLEKGYQYGGGQVKFPLKDEVQMAPNFTMESGNPMSDSLRFRYHLQMGWPQQYYSSIKGDTLEFVANNYGKTEADFLAVNPRLSYNNDGTLVEGQKIKIPNDSVNNNVLIYWKSTNNERTSKSSHNAVLEGNANVESDSITAEVSNESIYGVVDWVSEEKIYDGVINLNDIRKEYKRTHTIPDSGDSAQVEYIAVTGDTYKKIAQKFGVYEEDVRRLNGVTAVDAQPAVGDRVLVPSKIVLPTIHPKAIVDDSPYKITIVYNSVKKKDGKILSEDVITTKTMETTFKTVTMRDVEIVRGTIENGKDLLQHARVTQILQARSGIRTFNPGLDFKQTDNYIDWSQSAAAGAEPAAGTTYYVDYVCEVPATVTVHIDTEYLEQGGVDRIWRSPEVKEYSGICSPGQDFVSELPLFEEWLGLPDPNVEDIQYVVEDNDIWVKTWVEERKSKWYIIGSLQDRVPKDNWFPTIKTGYYYLGKEEHYLFNEPIIIEPTEKEIPIATNVEYVPGKFENAAQLQEGSSNIIRNSGFDVMNTTLTVFKLTF